MSDSFISLLSDYESDKSLVVRTRVSSSSNPSPFIYDCMSHKVISIIDDSDAERLYMGSSDEGASSRDSSFNALFFDDNVEVTMEIKAASLRRECARDYAKFYQKSYKQDPSDTDIKDHLECGARPD
ncbi:unnamed protein product [Vicia faba]|uniref:Uncharacterized protein n=1 Tax=Vicia faba TaxID=3906 RepID=A0AAV0Z9X4_VICFA|nr:unnamed protein product [Vicia faba]